MTTSPAPLDTTTDYALRYAATGLRVLPIRPGAKVPALTAWTDAATTDPATITSWWAGLYRGHGIGIAVGQLPDGRWCFAVDIDGASHGVDGATTWHDLCAAYPDHPVPDTVEATTGGGGTHLLFAAPHEVRNGRLGEGIDIRGHGGQILVEPSLHPNGQPYTWLDGHAPWEQAIADAPPWLIAMLTPAEPEPAPRTTPPVATGDRPGDAYAATTTWAQILQHDGWTLHHTSRDGEDHWTRPGKTTREGTSATTGYKGSDVLKVFTTAVPSLRPDDTYTKLGYLAATRYDGDHSAAASALRAAGHGGTTEPDLSWIPAPTTPLGGDDDDDEGNHHGWEPADLTAVLADGYDPPRPTLGARQGGGALFYAGRINALYGPSGAGKSWVAMWVCAEQIRTGNHVIYIDLEDHVASVTDRLRALGLTSEQLTDLFTYISPAMPWGAAAKAWMTTHIVDTGTTVAVVDSTGEAMALNGVKPNDDDDVAVWFRAVPRHIARLGVAVILTDHVPKDTNRPKGFAIGSQRKRAAIDGLAYDVDARVAPARGVDGHLGLLVAKDRNGAYQQGNKVANVHITSDPDGVGVTITVEAPEVGHRPTMIMERVSRYLEDAGPQSRRTIEDKVVGKGSVIRIAVDYLVNEKWLKAEKRVGRGPVSDLYDVVMPFRSDMEWIPDTVPEPVDNPIASPASQSRPGDEGRDSERMEIESRPPRPRHSYTGRGGGRDSTSSASEDAPLDGESRPSSSEGHPGHVTDPDLDIF